MVNKPEKWTKLPVTIEAWQVTDDPKQRIQMVAWIRAHGGTAEIVNSPAGINLDTLEGTMRADIGDWIIKGIQGEFYPCKPDIFTVTYERNHDRPTDPGPNGDTFRLGCARCESDEQEFIATLDAEGKAP